jgi:hypothetical protein
MVTAPSKAYTSRRTTKTPQIQSKCKGFALLTLSEPFAISHLLTHFPYYRHQPAAKNSAAASADGHYSATKRRPKS